MDEDIFKKYTGITKIPATINSPLRKDDMASFCIFRGKTKVRYKDQATGDTGDAYDLVMKMFGENFQEAKDRIARDIGSDNIPREIRRSNYDKLRGGNEVAIIPTILKDYPKHFLDYWASYGISKKQLEDNRHIYPLHSFRINNTTIYANKELMILYRWSYKGKNYYKIYQPFNKKHKFLNNMSGVSEKILHNAENINKGIPYLIITKSVKDVEVLRSLGYTNTIGVQGEGFAMDKEIMEKLIKTFKDKIYLVFDNDWEKEVNRGQEYAKSIIETYPELNNIVLPENPGCTDVSDHIFNKHKQQINILFYEEIISKFKRIYRRKTN